MKKLVLAVLIAMLFAVPSLFAAETWDEPPSRLLPAPRGTDSTGTAFVPQNRSDCVNSAGFASPTQPGDVRLAASGEGGPQTIFLQDGRTIQAEGSETLGDRIRVETPAGRIDLPSSQVLSIHPMDSPSGSPSTPPPAEVYRGLTQQMTDQVRGQIRGQASSAPGK